VGQKDGSGWILVWDRGDQWLFVIEHAVSVSNPMYMYFLFRLHQHNQ
jgi:hypothetical protein